VPVIPNFRVSLRASVLLALRKGLLHALFVCALISGEGLVHHETPMLSSRLQAAVRLQPASPEQADRITRPTSEPYTGDLSIFEDPNRAEKLQVERVMDVLQIKEGSSVADIGAGSGWFTVRAARRVGAAGTVYAVEINPDYLKHIAERAKRENLSNIRTVLGKEDDAMLPAGSVDSVLILKTYHEIAQPIRLLGRLRNAMRSGALLGIIDRNGRGDDHGIDPKVITAEAARAGFSLINQYDFVKGDGMDYFLVFKLGQS
jgi:SAM-dependent methyltransferase